MHFYSHVFVGVFCSVFVCFVYLEWSFLVLQSLCYRRELVALLKYSCCDVDVSVLCCFLSCCCVSVAFPCHSQFLLDYWYDLSDIQDIKNQTMQNLMKVNLFAHPLGQF